MALLLLDPARPIGVAETGLEVSRARGEPAPHVVLVLGGTNDLGSATRQRKKSRIGKGPRHGS